MILFWKYILLSNITESLKEKWYFIMLCSKMGYLANNLMTLAQNR